MKIIVKPAGKHSLGAQFLSMALIIYILLISSIFPFDWFKEFTGGEICFFKRFTGFPCLFCGLTRSLSSAFRLGFKESFSYNPGGLIIFLVFVAVFVNSVMQIAAGKKIYISTTGREKTLLIMGAFILLLFNWVLKIANESPVN